MALTVNTNQSSLIVQKSLSDATQGLNQAIERMTTGFKINSARDDAAGYAVATKMETQISSLEVCQNNVDMAMSLINTVTGAYDLILTHLQRMRDLTEEAYNGTYGADSIAAIQAEYDARYQEIERLFMSSEYNGLKFFTNSLGTTFKFQIGITADGNSQISFSTKGITNFVPEISLFTSDENGILADRDDPDYSALALIDVVIDDINTEQTQAGAILNRLESAREALDVQYSNTVASLSTIKDADIATESSSYIKHQILQQASASLLATANQSPSLALQLI